MLNTGSKLSLQYQRSILRYLWVGITQKRFPSRVTGWGSCLAVKENPTIPLVTQSWIRLRPVLSGICGSDLAVLSSNGSRYLSALTSFPFTLGHELVAYVTEIGREVIRVKVGDRVVLEPALGCEVRGFREKCFSCQMGRYGNCERVTEGDIGIGVQTGYCHDTGGGWSEDLIAHESQVHKVPKEITDQIAVLAEPLSCALHAVFRADVTERAKVLVLGCGSMGLLTIAALRYLRPNCRIVAVAKYPHQGEWARYLGSDYVVQPGIKSYGDLAELFGASLKQLIWQKPAVIGGADTTFDCVGSSQSLEDVVRWTRSGGTAVIIGMPGVSKIDLAPMWYQELRIVGAYTYGLENLNKRSVRTFQLSLELLAEPFWGGKFRRFVTHRFPLHRYKDAISTAMKTGKTESVKVVFDVNARFN